MKFKTLFLTLLFFVLFFIIQYPVGRILRGDYNSFARIMMQDLHQKNQNIDVLFLGDSHIYRAIDPEQFYETTKKDCFIAGFPGQEIDGTYAILQEALLYHPEIKEVYIDLDISQIFNEDFAERTQLKHVYACSNNLKNPRIKFEYLLHATSPYYYINSLLQIGKNKINPKPKSMIKTFKYLLNGNYFKLIYPKSKNEVFKGRGYIPSFETIDATLSGSNEMQTFIPENISKDYINTINKIISFCNSNDLKLNFVSIPITDYSINHYTNYDEYNSYINKFLEQKQLTFWDFNLLKLEYLNLNEKDFYDSEHVNLSGAEKINSAFSKLLLSNDDASYLFYDSLQTKHNYQSAAIFGIDFKDNDDGKSFELLPIANLKDDSSLTYKIDIKTSNNTINNYIENTSDTVVFYPEQSEGTLIISAYLNNNYQCSIEKQYFTTWIN